MKKMLSLILTLLLTILTLASCTAFEKEPLPNDYGSKEPITTETKDKGPWRPEDITENPDLDGDSDEGAVSEGRLYFHLNSKTQALLVDSKGSLIWLYSFDNKEIFTSFDTGDYVRVGHGMIMETYPGQTYISKIVLIEDGDINSFTDEEWSRLSDVFVDGLER